MNEKFNKNAKLETFTNILGIAVRLIVIDPYHFLFLVSTRQRRVWHPLAGGQS